MPMNVREPALRMKWAEDSMELSLAPLQGHWTEEQYLLLTDQTSHLVEFADGYVEVLPMPTDSHQVILRFIFLALHAFLSPHGGVVLFAPLRVRIREDKFREPDIILLLDGKDARRQERYWLGADLVVEVVSDDAPERDLRDKRLDYAEAGIPEYWIVNPTNETILVLRLDGKRYSESGVFHRGENAASRLLNGFTVPVSDVFDAQ